MTNLARVIATLAVLAALAASVPVQTPEIDALLARAQGPLMSDPDAPDPTADPGTALYHAQLCARYLGPIPALS